MIGIRSGEKLHEEMITINDSFNTLESKDFFIILPPNKVKNYFKEIHKSKFFWFCIVYYLIALIVWKYI